MEPTIDILWPQYRKQPAKAQTKKAYKSPDEIKSSSPSSSSSNSSSSPSQNDSDDDDVILTELTSKTKILPDKLTESEENDDELQESLAECALANNQATTSKSSDSGMETNLIIAEDTQSSSDDKTLKSIGT